ncbi:MAG: ricin-type beta-trefoil lectin domain protein [Candidatus Rokubacteria bacterium]|nr:ricin-type beta-trefoil lectin domain protein [Candidatus Rokubacteria bacterium]
MTGLLSAARIAAAVLTVGVLLAEVPRPEAGRPSRQCREGESVEQCARRERLQGKATQAAARVRTTYRQVLNREPTQDEINFHVGLGGPWSIGAGTDGAVRASVQLFDRVDKRYPRHGRIVFKGWAEIPQWLPDDVWVKRHAEAMARGELDESSLRAQLRDRTVTWAIQRAFEAELKSQGSLGPFLLDPGSRTWKLARGQVDRGTVQGINGLATWLKTHPQVRQDVADLPRLEREAAAAALEASFAAEVTRWPALASYLREDRRPPLKAALADLRAGQEGGGPDGIRRWLARQEVRARYWQTHGVGSRVATLERDAVVTGLQGAFDREVRLFPGLMGYLLDPSQPPYRTALVDLRAGREGGGAAGIAAYLRKPGVRDYYWSALGIVQQYALQEREAVREALTAAFASEVRSRPALVAYLVDEGQPPYRTALVDLRAGREGGGAEGIATYLGKPGVRQYYWNTLGIGRKAVELAARETAQAVLQGARETLGQGVVLLGAASNKCVRPMGSTSGAALQLVECTGQADQRFELVDGALKFQGKCVDARGGQGRNGDAILLWDCTGGANQRWAADGDGRIKGINGRCLDVEKENMAAGARLVLWDCKWPAARHQQWFVGRRLGFAYAFFRPNMPLVAGHVGWGYQQADGSFRAGAVDGTGIAPYIASQDDRGYHWIEKFPTEKAMTDYFRRWGEGTKDAQYTEVKRIAVLDPDYEGARAKADSFVGSGYIVVIKNCMDETNAVIQAYGAKGMPWPQTNWFPYFWFTNMASTAHHRL